MSNNAPCVFVFDNLIEANTEKFNPCDQTLKLSVPKQVFSCNQMDLAAVSIRAQEFGKRFKSGMV